jgi:hypothetical protein
MGAFFLYHEKSDVPQEKLLILYKNKGFNNPKYIKLGSYNLVLYKKQIVDISNYVINEMHELYVCGSLFYKGLSYNKSIRKILNDITSNKVDPSRLFGNYIIIIFNKSNNGIELITDPSVNKVFYIDKSNRLISTDFLAILTARNNNYNINRLAVIENIITGNLIPPDTYINEIERVDRISVKNLNTYFPSITFNYFKPTINDNIRTRKEAIEHANNMLDNYFADAASISNQYGAHIGLTGGYDSRLLLMHARRNIANLITNSFWRQKSEEYENAKTLARAADIYFYSFEDYSYKSPDTESIMNESYYVYDGQIRADNRWDQIFTLRDYTKKIANKHYVGFHGCGGEQYRNADHVIRPINDRTYLIYEWLLKLTPDPFLDKSLKQDLYIYIKHKLSRLTNINHSKYSLYDIKKIQNEVWNPSNRITRINTLNQQQFYFAPFTEYLISEYAYRYIPFLGGSVDYQIDMIRKYDPQLAAVSTNYGFNLLDGEAYLKKYYYTIASLLPRKAVITIYNSIKSIYDDQYDNEKYLKSLHPYLAELNDKIDYSILLKNSNLASGIVSFSHFLNRIS